MSNKNLEFLIAHPNMSGMRAAEELGISKQRVSQLRKKHGLPTRVVDLPEDVELSGEWGRPNNHGNLGHRNHLYTGCVSELLVAADLIKRGMAVFRALHPVASVDLIAMIGMSELYRVEVKSAKKRTVSMKIWHAQVHRDRYDILAFVCEDGSIVYRHREDDGVVPWSDD